MSEVLAVVWQPGALNLIRIPDKGIWSSDNIVLNSVELEFPTRIGRLDDLTSDGQILSAFNKLLDNTELSSPLWVLLPSVWLQRYNLKVINLKDAALQRSHLVWEVEQRLHGELSAYSLMLPHEITGNTVMAVVCRREITSNMTSVLLSGNTEFAGMWVEPETGEEYDLNDALDLREIKPIEEQSSERIKLTSGVSPLLAGGVVAVIAIAAAIFYFMPDIGSSPEKKITPEMTAVSPEQPTMETATVELQEKKVTEKPAPAASVKSESVSPLMLLSQKLPGKAEIQLATISTAEFRVEVADVISPESWLKELRNVNGLEGLKIVDQYKADNRRILVLRQPNPGWRDSKAGRDVNLWKKLVGAAGLRLNGRSAVGKRKSALTLVDAVWGNPAGFSKIYIAQVDGQWRVTVQ